MSGVSLRVSANRLPEWARELPVLAKRVDADTAQDVARDWAAGVRVDTGELRDSIHAAGDTVVAGADHAVFENYGTRTMAGSFALEKAVEKNRATHVERLRRALPQ